MTNSQIMAKYAALQADIETLSSQLTETLGADLSHKNYPDTRTWREALDAHDAQVREQTKALRQKEFQLNQLSKDLVSFALSLLSLTELPAADICQQLKCSEETASVLQRLVVDQSSCLSSIDSPRSISTEPVSFPG